MRLIIAIILICFTIGCSNTDKKDVPSEIIVKIGSENITKSELEDELNKLPQKQKALYMSSPQRLNEFLQSKINEKILYQQALTRGIHERGDIREKIENYEAKLIAKTLGKEILEELEISSDEIKTHFEENKKNYERIDISKIVIRYNPDEEASKTAAISMAENIRERAISGESFEELASEFSDDPLSKQRLGSIGYINRGRFPEEIDSVIFGLNEGEITKPFEVDGAYLIIKANKDPDFPPYAQIERLIRSELISKGLLDYMNSLKDELDVQIYEERLQEIVQSESNDK